MAMKTKTKTRLEIEVKRHKVCLQIYIADSDVLIHTYIFDDRDKFTFEGLYAELNFMNKISDYT